MSEAYFTLNTRDTDEITFKVAGRIPISPLDVSGYTVDMLRISLIFDNFEGGSVLVDPDLGVFWQQYGSGAAPVILADPPGTDDFVIVFKWGPTGPSVQVNGGGFVDASPSLPMVTGETRFRLDTNDGTGGGLQAAVVYYVDAVVQPAARELFWTAFRGSHEVP